MTDVKALLGQLRSEDPRFDEAQAVVDLVRSAAELLVGMRERAGWTQAQLADYLGVTVGRVSQLESGALRHAPSLKMMARIAHACGEAVALTSAGTRAESEEKPRSVELEWSEL